MKPRHYTDLGSDGNCTSTSPPRMKETPGMLTDYLVPALAITATLREKEEGGLVVVVQGHHRHHTAKQYDFNHGAACPFADAVTMYIDELQLMGKATGDVYRIHNAWERDSKTFIFTG